jgi:hypothetical protein
MRHSIHDKTLAAKKARILINALVDCAKAGIKSSFVIKRMLYGVSLVDARLIAAVYPSRGSLAYERMI